MGRLGRRRPDQNLDDALTAVTGDELSPGWLQQLQDLDPEKLPLLKTERRIGPAIPRPLNFVCIGLNYADHAAETGAKSPKEPIVFLKSLVGVLRPVR